MTRPLADAYRHLGFTPGEDFTIEDDGAGPVVTAWLTTTAQPTEQEIDGAVAAVGAIAVQRQFSAAIQSHLDRRASERHYDSIQSAVTYRDDPNPQYAAEAVALFDWRSAVWTHVEQVLAGVLAGTRTQPTIEELIADLPPFAWP